MRSGCRSIFERRAPDSHARARGQPARKLQCASRPVRVQRPTGHATLSRALALALPPPHLSLSRKLRQSRNPCQSRLRETQSLSRKLLLPRTCRPGSKCGAEPHAEGRALRSLRIRCTISTSCPEELDGRKAGSVASTKPGEGPARAEARRMGCSPVGYPSARATQAPSSDASSLPPSFSPPLSPWPPPTRPVMPSQLPPGPHRSQRSAGRSRLQTDASRARSAAGSPPLRRAAIAGLPPPLSLPVPRGAEGRLPLEARGRGLPPCPSRDRGRGARGRGTPRL